MQLLRSLLAGLALAVLTSGAALAQCGTTAPGNRVCGNATGSSGLATWIQVPAGALSAIAPGTVLGNPTGASAVPVATAAPLLGLPGTTGGQLGLAGSASGTVTLAPQAAAGTATLTLPNTSGTLAATASAPLALNATTGNLSITGLSGGVLAGAGPAFTRTPVLGLNGTAAGTLGFAGATSGTATITPQAAAGTPTLTLPNASGTFAVNATTPLVLSATTGGLTCPTCVTSSGGGAITGTAPISVSAAGVVSINAPYTTLTASNGGIVYSGAANLAILAGTATAQQMLQSGAAGAPAWSTATWPATTTANQLLYSSALNTVSGLATANNSVLSTNGSGVPALSTTLPSGIAATNMSLTTPVIAAGTPTTSGALGFSSGVLTYGDGINNRLVVSTDQVQTLSNKTFVAPVLGAATGTSIAIGGCSLGSAVICSSGQLFVSSNSSLALAVGANGQTNPVLQVDASSASQAAGLSVKGFAAGSGVSITAISSATNEGLLINAKGTSGIQIGSTSSGGVAIGSGGGGVSINSTIGGTAFGSGVATALGVASSAAGGLPIIIAKGTAAMGTSAIASGACATVVTAAATGVATTDVIDAAFNADPTGTTGYTAPNMLTIVPYPTANNVNFKVCNNTAVSLTPGAVITLNWKVVR